MSNLCKSTKCTFKLYLPEPFLLSESPRFFYQTAPTLIPDAGSTGMPNFASASHITRYVKITNYVSLAPLKTSLAQDPTWFLQEVIAMKKDKVLQDVLETYSTGILKLKWTLGRSWQLKHNRIEPAWSGKKKQLIKHRVYQSPDDHQLQCETRRGMPSRVVFFFIFSYYYTPSSVHFREITI